MSTVRPEVVEALVKAFASSGDIALALSAVTFEFSPEPTEEERAWGRQRYLGMNADERRAAREG